MLRRDATEPQANLDYEERLFNNLRAKPEPACLFYVNSRCIVLGRGNAAEQWVRLDAALADGVPLLRRFSGGGAVYHDWRVLNFSFIMPKSILDGAEPSSTMVPGPIRYIDYFRRIVIRALSRSGDGFSATGVSDVSLNGRKISGNAQRIASNLVLHHGTLLMQCPLAEIERYLQLPPNRPGIAHRDFVTGLLEEGRALQEEQLQLWLAEEFNAACAG
jgi:lipoate---protein ligase